MSAEEIINNKLLRIYKSLAKANQKNKRYILILEKKAEVLEEVLRELKDSEKGE